MNAKINPAILALIIPLIAVVAAVFFLAVKHESASAYEQFSYSKYIEAPKQLAGNKYSLKGEIDLKLAELPGGKLISVKCSDFGGKRIAVFFPNGLDVNIYTGQRFDMRVEIGTQGQIKASELKKY